MMTPRLPLLSPLLSVACTTLLVACSGGGSDAPVETSAMAQLGERIFNDRRLSGSGRMSCATCHDPTTFHGPPNALAVQIGGRFETEFGVRAAPSLRYLERQPAFDGARVHGGLMADGRADTLGQQAQLPWFSILELDNGSTADLARRLRAAPYASEFAALFGSDADAATTVAQMAQALQAFQTEDPRLHPYDSKFDLVAAGRDHFSAAEERGLQVFNDPARGNCAACHTSRPGADGKPPLFTDFSYAALGVPRNTAIPHNANAAYFDLGLCGPQRADLAQRPELCGLFRTPSLRNVATRGAFFHNGVLHSLAEVLRFYNSRDTHPSLWYPSAGGQVQAFDDLPLRYRANLTLQAPLDGRAPGAAPAMTDAELADLECFLRTLTDGHAAGTPPTSGCT